MKQKLICTDYDSMGDFSRFPIPLDKKKNKKYFDLSVFFRIFVKNKML